MIFEQSVQKSITFKKAQTDGKRHLIYLTSVVMLPNLIHFRKNVFFKTALKIFRPSAKKINDAPITEILFTIAYGINSRQSYSTVFEYHDDHLVEKDTFQKHPEKRGKDTVLKQCRYHHAFLKETSLC